jgi:hypothetical protein
MSDFWFVVIILGPVVLYYGTRRSERRQRTFVWVFVLTVASLLVYNALWGTCGRWGPWIEDFCTEPP